MTEPVLTVENLTITANSGRVLVDDVSFSVTPGEVLALVGESGSGKTTVALALLGFTRRGANWRNGTVRIRDTEVWSGSERERRELRGRAISYVPQDPATQLNPAHTIGRQLGEALDREGADSEEARLELLRNVGLPAEPRVLNSYPFELSGGQQQRVAIAMALAVRPAVIVLDEPTTGLDVTTQKRILELLRKLAHSSELAFVYITHDLGAVRWLADRAAVMRTGRIIEIGSTESVLHLPLEPYTKLLVASAPSHQGIRLFRGPVDSDPVRPPIEHSEAATVATSNLIPSRQVRASEVSLLRPPGLDRGAGAALLQLRNVGLTYTTRRRRRIQVLNGIDLSVSAGETLAIVGESGSGKSTMGRSICGLAPESSGELLLNGQPLPWNVRSRTREQLRSVQMVYQNPDRSLNPMETVRESIDRSISSFHGKVPAAERGRLIESVLDEVHLARMHAGKYPRELSGGEKQRAAIARALVGLPKLLICDEVTSALDASTQAVIVSLLGELNARGLSVLYITHDLGTVRSVAHRIAVLHHGQICELDGTDRILDEPVHDYTKELLAATMFVA